MYNKNQKRHLISNIFTTFWFSVNCGLLSHIVSIGTNNTALLLSHNSAKLAASHLLSHTPPCSNNNRQAPSPTLRHIIPLLFKPPNLSSSDPPLCPTTTDQILIIL